MIACMVFKARPRQLRLHCWAEGVPFLTIFLVCALVNGYSARAQSSSADAASSAQPASAPADDVIERLSRRVADRPDDAAAAAQLITANVAADRLDMADRLIEAAEKRFGGHTEFEAAAAYADERRERWENVVGRLWPLVSSASVDDAMRLARAMRKLNRNDEADAAIRAALDRSATSVPLWCAWIDAAINDNRPAAALERIRNARDAGVSDPRLTYRAARATSRLEHGFGKAEVRALSNARPGQFVDGWLVLEATAQTGRYLCAPTASAVALAREALDAGMDEPECLLVQADIWNRAGRFAAAREILKSRPEEYWRSVDDVGLEQISRFLFDAGDVNTGVSWSRIRAERSPARRDEILTAAFLRAADVFNQRGDAELHRDYLRRAMELRPADDGLKLRLADADWSAGDRERAVKAYRALLEARPSAEAEVRILERLAEWQTSQAGSERR
ncbi:MAG: hypothetical protein JNG88_10960 [Phycisphaerales bacterium]|nr:hypothetical protein [Phycisphaerales bacterium]